MDQGAAPAKKPLPKAVVFFGILVLLFTVLPTLQTIGLGFILGFDSELFVIRLWSTGLVWLAPAGLVLVMAPMLAPLNTKLLFRVRLVCAPITASALALLIWLAASGNMPSVMLVVGVVIALMSWVNTFVIERLSAKKAPQSQA